MWQLVTGSRYNRRVTGKTPVTFSGPVGPGHPALQANNPPMGTLNNCAHGYTPWGTYLTCEENWNGYLGTTDATWTPSPQQARYGISAAGFGYRWHTADPRFDVAVNPNELNRFGWVVEYDPANPRSTPVKRTALGRFKHEGAWATESRGWRCRSGSTTARGEVHLTGPGLHGDPLGAIHPGGPQGVGRLPCPQDDEDRFGSPDGIGGGVIGT